MIAAAAVRRLPCRDDQGVVVLRRPGQVLLDINAARHHGPIRAPSHHDASARPPHDLAQGLQQHDGVERHHAYAERRAIDAADGLRDQDAPAARDPTDLRYIDVETMVVADLAYAKGFAVRDGHADGSIGRRSGDIAGHVHGAGDGTDRKRRRRL